MKEKFIDFFKKNIVIFMYIFFCLVFEIVSILFIGCEPFLSKPLYPIILYGFIVSIMFLIKKYKIRAIFGGVILILQLISNVGFIYLYDSNGTFFEWAMFNQRDDAFGTIEDLRLRWGLLLLLFVLLISYALGCYFAYKKMYEKLDIDDKTPVNKYIKISFCASLLLTLVIPVTDALTSVNSNYVDKYLYGSGTNRYQEVGITSNVVYEFLNGTLADALVEYDEEGIEDFVFNNEDPYLATSSYNGISKGNNLVYILVESFEWYSFLHNCTPEQSKVLYPNLNKFFNDSIYANNFYAREKTDTAEMLALLGSNPTRKFTNYDFPNNNFWWSLPNLFSKSVEENGNNIKQIKSFHQNNGTFYNRKTLHKSLGFDEMIDIEYMVENCGMINTWNEEEFKGERNLDSETVSKLKKEMFPKTDDNEQYMTFWLTFAMHGYYVERETFKIAGYYDLLDSVGAYPAGISTKADYLRTYAAAVMDFDRALGIMMDQLEENGQLDKTTIVMFSDHNTYYNNLSYYAKGIEERHNSELYRIPFMIYDQKLKAAYVENEKTNVINKFTTTSDMIPTIFDLFGIQGYKNLYYGSSMFLKDVESVIFSRAYGIFVTDKLICYSADELLYTSIDFKDEDLEDFKKRAEILLKKQEYLDKIYYNDYFKEKSMLI